MSSENAITRTRPNTITTAAPQQHEARMWTYQPDVDILHQDDAYAVLLDMPGVAPENLDITVENRTLVVHGRVTRPAVPENASIVRHEYGVGNFLRRFDLDDSVDTDRITAECACGVVTLYLPKLDQARPKRISISVRDGSSA